MLCVENVGMDSGGHREARLVLLRDVLFDPAVDELGDFVAVLFEHHFVPVAVEAHVFHAHELRLHACLVQPFGQAVVEFTVIAAFGRQINDRNLFQIHELVRRLLLHVAGNHVAGDVRFFFERHLQFGRIS